MAGEIQVGAIYFNGNTDPVYRVKYFGKILWIAIFPPANACFVGIINPAQVAALQALATVIFFKIGSLAHKAIANAKNGLGTLVKFRPPAVLDDPPFVGYQVLIMHVL